jgi:hypothetical protein
LDITWSIENQYPNNEEKFPNAKKSFLHKIGKNWGSEKK